MKFFLLFIIVSISSLSWAQKTSCENGFFLVKKNKEFFSYKIEEKGKIIAAKTPIDLLIYNQNYTYFKISKTDFLLANKSTKSSIQVSYKLLDVSQERKICLEDFQILSFPFIEGKKDFIILTSQDGIAFLRFDIIK